MMQEDLAVQWQWDAAASARAQQALAAELGSAVQYRLQNRSQPILQPMTKQQVCSSVFTNPCTRIRADESVSTKQARDYLANPNLGNRSRYGQFPVQNNPFKWAELEDDAEGEHELILERYGLRKIEMWIFPEGYHSPLLIDSPLFNQKTLFLLEGEVRTCSSVFTNPCSRIRLHESVHTE